MQRCVGNYVNLFVCGTNFFYKWLRFAIIILFEFQWLIMSYNNDLTKKEIAHYFRKHGHLLKWKNHTENMLEIGCAHGSITRTVLYPHVKDHVGKMLAVDLVPEMIELAKERNDTDEIEFRIMDIMAKENIEELRGKFDHIFVLYVVHWIADQRRFFETLYHLLKPEGQIFVTIMVDTPVHQSYKKQNEEGKWSKYLPQEQVLADYTSNPVHYVCNIVNDVGFKIEVCEIEQKKSDVLDLKDMVRALIALYKYIDRVPPELQGEYFQYHLKIQKMLCTYVGEPDLYEFPYETLLCIASKNM